MDGSSNVIKVPSDVSDTYIVLLDSRIDVLAG